MDETPVLTRVDDGVAIVTLNRPSRMNAVNGALRTSLIDALARLDGDGTIRAMVIAGAGEAAFCAGQDLDEAAAMTPERVPAWLGHQRAMYQAVREVDKPCVAAIRGVAAGAGIQLALCADWRVCAPDARLGQPEVRAGLASIVGSYLIALHAGRTHVAQLALAGELVGGQRAFEMGLVTELAEAGAVLSTAVERARKLGRLPATAVRLSKRRMREATQADFDEACEAGIRAQLECYAAGEPQRAMADFIERRNAKVRQDAPHE